MSGQLPRSAVAIRKPRLDLGFDAADIATLDGKML